MHSISRQVLSSKPGFLVSRGLSSMANIDASKLTIEKTAQLKPKPDLNGLGFGKEFSDYMLDVNWTANHGWEAPKIVPFQNLSLSPAASCLHYALQCFEGMKCYMDANGTPRLFRPDMNMKRMNTSMERLCLPSFDGDNLTECIKELIRLEKDWVPKQEGYSLYIRPTAISTHPFVGVAAAEDAKIFTILSPVGPYYPEGFKPVTLYADKVNRRAWPGGTGDVKIGGNYAPSIRPSDAAIKKGYSQILWLFGDENYVTEVGTMNLLFFWKKADGSGTELVTAPLDGTILPGVTRDSILSLCRTWGEFEVNERDITMDEVAEQIRAGNMIEAFGCGTAAVVSPVKMIHFDGVDYDVPLDKDDANAQAGKLTTRLWKSLLDIQYGRVEHEWSVPVV